MRTGTALVSNYNARSNRDPSLGPLKETDEEGGKTGLAYKDMSPFYYYFATITFYVLAIAASCIIPDVDLIFEFVGVICVNCMAFLFPGVFYLTASKRYFAKKRTTSNFMPEVNELKRNKCLEFTAYVKIFAGIIVLVAGMFNNIHELLEE